MSAAPSLPVWPVLAATTGTQAFSTLTVMALASVAPAAATTLGIPAALIGYQVAITYGAAAVTALFGGAMVRRLGATRTSQTALWLCTAGTLLSASGSLIGLGLGAVVIGLGYGCTNPAASHLLNRAPTGRHMNLIFSLKQCGVPIGGIIAALLVPPVTLAWSWQAGLLVCAALALALSALLQRARPHWDTDREPGAALLARPFQGLRIIWDHPILRWLAIASFAYSAVQLSLVGFLVTYLVTEAEIGLVVAASLLAITQTAGASGRLAWGWIADRLKSGTLTLIINGGIAMAAALATAAIAPGWPYWAIATAAAVFGFCAVGWNGVFVAVIARQAPRGEIGAATGGVLVLTYAGVLLGPSAFAALHDEAGLSYGAGYALMALMTLAGILALVQARRGIR